MILSITGPDGTDVYEAPDAEGRPGDLAAERLPDDRHPRRQHRPEQNRLWAEDARAAQRPRRPAPPGAPPRPAPRTTGATSRRMATWRRRRIRMRPASRSACGWATATTRPRTPGSRPRRSRPPAQVWHAFLRDYTKGWPVAKFEPPDGVVRGAIDRWTGGKPGPVDPRHRSRVVHRRGPSRRQGCRRRGRARCITRGCGGWMVDPVKAELGPERGGTTLRTGCAARDVASGIKGEYGSRTADGGQLIVGRHARRSRPDPAADQRMATATGMTTVPSRPRRRRRQHRPRCIRN